MTNPRRGGSRTAPTAVAFAITLALLIATLAFAACREDGESGRPSVTPAVVGTGPTATVRFPLPAGTTPATVVRAIDGDTIEVRVEGIEYTVRYIGIDTPETVDPRRPVGCFGEEASAYNKQLVEGLIVGLEKDVSETDQYGRLLRYVWLNQDTMVNVVLVRDGYAQSSAYPPDVRYQELFDQMEAEARTVGRGLWGPVCAESPTPVPEAGTPAAGLCEYSSTEDPLIKGNISSDGENIYHVPGGEFYDATVIDETAGERWFCTETEALAAGWRASLR